MSGEPAQARLPIDGEGRDVVFDHDKRLVEALLFAAAEPLGEKALAERMTKPDQIEPVLAALRADYQGRGVGLHRIAGGWAFRTAPDLAAKLSQGGVQRRKLSRAARETLAIIAYHQPVTRAEIEAIRGITISKGTLDILVEAQWVRPGRRRQVPGRPLTWQTTPAFLDHFGLESLDALPGVEELRAAGLLDARPVITNLASSSDDAASDAEEADGGRFDDFDPSLPLDDEP